MKKFLSILLALAVGFTFTFGSAMSAFAAAPNYSDAQTALAKQVTESNAAIDKAATDLLAKMTFKDGYLVASGDAYKLGANDKAKGYIKETTIKKTINTLVSDAKTAVADAVTAQYAVGGVLNDETDSYTADEINQAVANVKVAGNTEITDLTIGAVLGALDAGSNYYTLEDYLTVALVDEYKKAALEELAAYDLSVYSNNDLEKVTLNAAKDAKVIAAAGSGLTAGQAYTYKNIVKAILDNQTAVVNGVTGTNGDADANADAIKSIKDALQAASYNILGHKKTSAADEYYEAIPTISDLADTTTLDGRKTAKITALKAELATELLAVKAQLQTALDTENQNAVTDAESVAAIKEDIANADKQFANIEKVLTERVNYCKTIAQVDAIAAPDFTVAGKEYNTVALWKTNFKADATNHTTEVEEALDSYGEIIDSVDALKAYAEIIASQKDVNGKPLVDADVLADNLADQIEALYNGTTTLDSAKRAIAGSSQEVALISTKIAYINFINGKPTAGFEPVDANNKVVANAWNKSSATRSAADKNVVMTVGSNTLKVEEASATTVAVYDEAQADAVKELVKETESAIEAATTVKDVKTIFAAAQTKYEDIITTAKHIESWQAGGKLAAAYAKAGYDTDLNAYAAYSKSAKFADTTKYPNYAVNDIVKAAKSIVFEAYTVEEIPTKVAEAKAYIDALKTTDELTASKTAVEELIAKISVPATLADKDAIVAAADAYLAHSEILGATAPSNLTVLQAAISKYYDLEKDAFVKNYNALNTKTLTSADADAVKALKSSYKELVAFADDYADIQSLAAPSKGNIDTFEEKVLAAQVDDAMKLMIALPANPTAADKAQVEAARAAYEALPLEGKAMLVDTLAYDNLIDAEEALEINIAFGDAEAKAYVQDLAVTVRTAKSGKKVKVTAKADVQTLIDNGYTVTYKFYKSTKKGSGYKNTVNKAAKTYTNTNPVKGKNYYKVKLVVKNADGAVVATTPLTQCKYGVRTIK